MSKLISVKGLVSGPVIEDAFKNSLKTPLWNSEWAFILYSLFDSVENQIKLVIQDSVENSVRRYARNEG